MLGLSDSHRLDGTKANYFIGVNLLDEHPIAE